MSEVVTQPEPLQSPRTLREIEAFLDMPHNRDTILIQGARHLAAKAEEYLQQPDGNYGASLMTPEYFAQLFDPSLPTIAIDIENSFCAAELVGVAARQRYLNHQPTANVVFITGSTDCGQIVTTARGAHLELTHGIIISAYGQAFAGELPILVQPDLLETTSVRLLRQCADAGIHTLNHVDEVEQFRTKGPIIADLAEKSGLRSPDRFALAKMWQDDPEAQYVIKPSNGLGGIGVRMFKGVENRIDAEIYHNFLQKYGYEPIIERRIISWPLHEPNADNTRGERHDWNARAIIAGGQLIDLYIRADVVGGPINRHRGAKALSALDLAEWTEKPIIGGELLAKLIATAQNLAKTAPVGISGADLTIDEQGQPYLFELNMGRIGGLQTLAMMRNDLQQKLAAPDRLLETMLETLESQRPSKIRLLAAKCLQDVGLNKETDRQKLTRNLSSTFTGLWATDSLGGFARLPYEDIKHLYTLSDDLRQWFHARYATTDNHDDADTDYINFAPLEFSDDLGQIALKHNQPARLLDVLALFEQLIPDRQAYWDETRVVICGIAGQPNSAREAAKCAVQNGADYEKMLGLAIAAFRNSVYRESGLNKDDDDDDHDTISIVAKYMMGNYAGAMADLQKALEHDSQDEILLGVTGLRLALAENDAARAEQFAQTLHARYCHDAVLSAFTTVPGDSNSQWWQRLQAQAQMLHDAY